MATQAGWELLSTHGLAAFSLRKVAAAIGYAPGTLYHVFTDLDDLLQHVHAHTLGLLQTALESAVADYPPGRERLHALAIAYAEFARTYPKVWTGLFEHQPQQERPLPDAYRAQLDCLFGLIDASLPPHLPAEERSLLTPMLWANLHGLCVLSLAGKLALATSVSTDRLIAEWIARLELEP